MHKKTALVSNNNNKSNFHTLFSLLKQMSIFALIDCNSFYVSCERVFQPDIQTKPVIVLSNNDGCVISRSAESKALGIKMGEPYFKVKNLIEKNAVQVFSSNYTLYGDMSSRVMSILAEFSPEIEVYSIDEAFLLLDGMIDLKNYVKAMKAKVLQETGIPVSIGVGPTKTLAKLANHIAKQYTKSGVFALNCPNLRAKYFELIEIQEIWGVGRRHARTLREMGINTIAQFVEMDSALIHKQFSVVLLRTQKELRGESCIQLEEIAPISKCIASTRSFGKNVTAIEDLEAATTLHVSRLAQKLRLKKLGVKSFQLFAMNNRFDKQKFRIWSFTVNLPYVSNSTSTLLKAAIKGLQNIYDDNIIYKKLGVQAFELIPIGFYKQDLFSESEDERCSKLSELMDMINSKYGRNHIYYATLGTTRRDWLPKDMYRSKHYTTNIKDILEVR